MSTNSSTRSRSQTQAYLGLTITQEVEKQVAEAVKVCVKAALRTPDMKKLLRLSWEEKNEQEEKRQNDFISELQKEVQKLVKDKNIILNVQNEMKKTITDLQQVVEKNNKAFAALKQSTAAKQAEKEQKKRG